MHSLEAAANHAATLIASAAAATGAPVQPQEIELVTPREFSQGNLACPVAFAIAKKLKRPPAEVAQQLAVEVGKLLPDSTFEKTEAANGYLNFFASQEFYAASIAEAQSPGYAKTSEGQGKTFIVEYSQPNTGKPFHVGHIRSTILGDSIANCLAAHGYEVVRMNYLGDAGANVAKLLLAAGEFRDMPPMNDEKTMLAYYVRITKEIEANPALEERAKEIMQKIEEGDPAVLKQVREIREKSYAAFQRNYELLGVKFDSVVGESEFIDRSKKIAFEAEVKNAAFRDEKTGALVADLEKTGLANNILLRSNGTTLYFTRDLGLADWKYEKYAFAANLTTTASEQNFYFKQVIALLNLLGREYAANYKHMGYGLVTLQGEKMSSREGKVIFMEDVLNEAINAVKKEIEERKLPYTPEETEHISRTIGVGSVKFGFLRVGNSKNISFLPAREVRFDGDTGAYVQYTCVRAKNILRKAAGVAARPSGELEGVEKELAAMLSNYPAIAGQSARNYEPHSICEYLLKLSAKFSEFYEKCPVLQAENAHDKSKRLALVAATANVIEDGLMLLGISVPEKM